MGTRCVELSQPLLKGMPRAKAHGEVESGFDFPVHTRLLGSDVLVMENLGLGLQEVLGKRVRVAAAPFRMKEGDASPIAPLVMCD